MARSGPPPSILSHKVGVIIPAAGLGRRMGGDKLTLMLGGIPVIVRTLRLFQGISAVVRVVLVVREEEVQRYREEILPAWDLEGVEVVPGGAERYHSVAAGLAALDQGIDQVAVHDGARPLLPPDLLQRLLEAGWSLGAVIPGVPAVDTLKERLPGEPGIVRTTLDRSNIWQVQTPQVFRAELLRRAYAAGNHGATDDAALVEGLGEKVYLLEGSPENIKLTRPLDLIVAQAILKQRGEGLLMRVGFGYDIHAFMPGRPLWLGGILLPGETGLEGHSDADVLLHALMDALLGAVGEGDIGYYFPPGDERFRNISSAILLEQVVGIVAANGFRVGNVDLTVVAERPRVAPYASAMRDRIAGILGLSKERIGLKATTNEGLGPIGRGEGVAAWANVLLEGSG